MSNYQGGFMPRVILMILLTVASSSAMATENTPPNTSENDPSIECMTQIKSRKELQILKGKIDLESSADQPFEILANSSVPTKKEKEAISLWVSEHKRCKQLGDEWRNKKYPPAIIAILDKLYSEMYFLAADLYAKKISYGDFAKAQVKLYQEFNANVAGVIQQIRQQQQAEDQQREALKQQQAQQQREALEVEQQVEQQQAENKRRAALEMEQRYLQGLQIQQLHEQQKRLTMPRCSSLPPGMAGYYAQQGSCY